MTIKVKTNYWKYVYTTEENKWDYLKNGQVRSVCIIRAMEFN